MGRYSFSYSLVITTIFLCGCTLQTKVESLPLSTNGRWIVNENGKRVKLACVNWVSHSETILAEGLNKKPLDDISKTIKDLGFNCVRLTWPILLATNDSLASITIRDHFHSLGLNQTVIDIQKINPSILDLSLIKAFQGVVKSLGEKEVMVILDNHVSHPQWCCANNDGNGFFGDKYFDPDLWIKGLSIMADLFKGVSNVVGMSLRNELRGPKQNVPDWYRYMQKGAEAVHAANPNVLVILSGLSFDNDLAFINNHPVTLSFKGKLVFELHWYSFSDGNIWTSMNPNQACGQITRNVMRKAGFLLDKGWPLFVSEFGVDLRGTKVDEHRYLNCFMALASGLDFDWALWTLVGSYYLREGVVELNEYYGILNSDWSHIRNQAFLQKISAIQLPFQGPDSPDVEHNKVIFHPLTGLCVLRKSHFGPLSLGPCSNSDGWEYTPQNTLSIKGTHFCLQAQREGKPAKLRKKCSNFNSKWELISDSKLQLSSKIRYNSSVCLDIDSNNIIVTNACKCVSIDNTCDPGSQWFKLVDTTKS
ncbi:hypothetical protein Lal_00022038 [Lupinus albus]|uniref:Putative cellulase n=1 Tax=Lupinus albus TaxID=3870 RepID=A0A6A5M0A6_LUPAL|nr:putative cellulase [Lupinus albus]KAE9587790.1 putative cellulase [Lupinus albus]KAF1864362.1 hypothetical protein Lal_00022019 [Lupinus albus]KAF1864380.1 hypothetical protein Lal_00022038 [Lupinus albus]